MGTGDDRRLQALLGWPHLEANEDGRVHVHPGYVIKRCNACGRDFVVSVVRVLDRELCGRVSCQQLNIANGGDGDQDDERGIAL